MRKRILALFTVLLAFSFVSFLPTTTKAESETPKDGVDLMIVCAHPGDEYLFLSGALPLWTVYPKGKAGQFGDTAIRTALRDAGWRDTKSCAVSERLTATRYNRV